MKAKIVVKLFTDWEYTSFETFPAGTKVQMDEEQDAMFLGWHDAVIDGQQTFVPRHFVEDGKLLVDYNPTELRGSVGDVVEIQEIHTTWLLATNTANGQTGWIPALAVVSC